MQHTRMPTFTIRVHRWVFFLCCFLLSLHSSANRSTSACNASAHPCPPPHHLHPRLIFSKFFFSFLLYSLLCPHTNVFVHNAPHAHNHLQGKYSFCFFLYTHLCFFFIPIPSARNPSTCTCNASERQHVHALHPCLHTVSTTPFPSVGSFLFYFLFILICVHTHTSTIHTQVSFFSLLFFLSADLRPHTTHLHAM